MAEETKNKLYVGNLPFSVDSEGLKKLLLTSVKFLKQLSSPTKTLADQKALAL